MQVKIVDDPNREFRELIDLMKDSTNQAEEESKDGEGDD